MTETLSPLVLQFVPFVAENLFEPAVSDNGAGIEGLRDLGI